MIKINLSVKDQQKISAELKKAMAKLMTDKTVLIGIHEDDDARDDGQINNATLGAIQHFGTDDGNIPARPWLDAGVKSGESEYNDIVKENIEQPEVALEMIGVVAVGKVQEYMTNLVDPANAQSTVAVKGSANPLIDTGALRQSITYTITNSKPTEGIG